MDKTNESLNNTNYSNAVCPVLDTYPYAVVAAASAAVSGLCCIFVICLIFLFKKQHFFIQRIILYHCLAAIIDAFAHIFGLQYLGYQSLTQSEYQDTLCTISGFLTLLASWIIIVDYSVITFTLLMTAVFQKNVNRLEYLYVAMIFMLPLTFNWIPFIGNSFGEAGGWCWIRNINYDDCSEHRLGETFRIVLWNVPLFNILIVIIPTYLFTIAYAAREKQCKTGKNIIYDPEREAMKKDLIKDVWRILFFPLGVILLNIFNFILIIYNFLGTDIPHTVLMLHGAFSPFQGGYLALVYILDCDTLKRLAYSNVRAAITSRDTVHEYPIEEGREALSDSAYPTVNYRLYEDNNKVTG